MADLNLVRNLLAYENAAKELRIPREDLFSSESIEVHSSTGGFSRQMKSKPQRGFYLCWTFNYVIKNLESDLIHFSELFLDPLQNLPFVLVPCYHLTLAEEIPEDKDRPNHGASISINPRTNKVEISEYNRHSEEAKNLLKTVVQYKGGADLSEKLIHQMVSFYNNLREQAPVIELKRKI